VTLGETERRRPDDDDLRIIQPDFVAGDEVAGDPEAGGARLRVDAREPPAASRWIVASWNAAAPVGLSRRSAATIADDSKAGTTSFRVMESLPGI